MRLPLALVGALLLSASLAGCFERSGTLAIVLEVSSGGALNEFSRVNLSLDKIHLVGRNQNPPVLESQERRFELSAAARTGQEFRLFSGTVRSDTYDRITLTTPPGSTFQGTLRDGTTVAIVVPGGTLTQTISFEVPRGGDVTYAFSIGVRSNDPGQGQPTYSIVPFDEESGPR